MGRRVERTRNLGTWTEAQYWSAIRSCLRMKFRWWRPAAAALKRARVAKGMYLCSVCRNTFARQGVEVHHVIPCGSLRSLEDLPGFVQRLTEEDTNRYQVLCTLCHKEAK